jgi:hypothetical protein
MRDLRRFKVRGKLAPRFIEPFKILGKRGEVAYQLELPSLLSDVHDIFLEEMFASARGANTHGTFGCQERSFISRVPCQDFRDIRESYAEQEDQGVQGAVEPSSRGKSYLGEKRRIQGRVFEFLFRSVRISGTRFILRG